MTGDAGGTVSDGFRTGLGRIWEVLGGFGTPGFVAGPGRFVRGGASIFRKTASFCFICSISPDVPPHPRIKSGAGSTLLPRRGEGSPTVSAAVGGSHYAYDCSVCQGAPTAAPTAPVRIGEGSLSVIPAQARYPGVGDGFRPPPERRGGPSVIPAQAGIQGWGMGSGLRRNDEGGRRNDEGRRRNDGCLSRYDGRGVRRFHRTGPATWGCFPRSA